jgi:hypothetical protein
MDVSKLKVLMDAYTELVKVWAEAAPGDNCSRIWDATRFLERLIKQELSK